MNRLTPFDQKIKELKETNEGGLALYLPLGDPDLEQSISLAVYLFPNIFPTTCRSRS